MKPQEITFPSDSETLAGEVILPVGEGPHPAVLLVGGTISDTRDGDPALSLRGEMPRHGMLRVMAEHLADAGIASLRWDKRGVGASSGGDRDLVSDVWTDVEDADQALLALSRIPEVDETRIAVLGESAGAYFVCFLAARTQLPAAYVLQAALYTRIPDMLAFNYQRVTDYAGPGPDEAAWIRQVAPHALKLSHHRLAMIKAAEQGDDLFEVGEGPDRFRLGLAHLQQELTYPPAEQFRFIQKPVLVIQGACDLNVPPEDCYRVAETIRQAGNSAVTLVVVPGADHSMQLAPNDLETCLRERISMASFSRPYAPEFLTALSDWLWQQFRL